MKRLNKDEMMNITAGARYSEKCDRCGIEFVQTYTNCPLIALLTGTPSFSMAQTRVKNMIRSHQSWCPSR